MSDIKLASVRGDSAANAEIAKSMLQVAISNIETLPDFVKVSPGQYLVDHVVNAEIKDHEEHGVQIVVTFALGETVALAKYPNVSSTDLPTEEVPAVGSLVGFSFIGALGVQQFIKAFGDLVKDSTHEVTVPQLVEGLAMGQYGSLGIVTGLRADRERKELDPVSGQEVPKTYVTLGKVICA